MKTFLSFLLLPCSLAWAGHELGSGRNSKAYLCNDYVADAGYVAQLLDGGQAISLDLFAEARTGNEWIASRELKLSRIRGLYREYLSNSRLPMRAVLQDPDREGRRELRVEWSEISPTDHLIQKKADLICSPSED